MRNFETDAVEAFAEEEKINEGKVGGTLNKFKDRAGFADLKTSNYN